MHALYLKPKEHRRIQKGHLWVFSNELATVPHDIAAGETVQLHTHDRKLIGAGFYNPNSLISFRLLTHGEELPDREFFRKNFRKPSTSARRYTNWTTQMPGVLCMESQTVFPGSLLTVLVKE